MDLQRALIRAKGLPLMLSTLQLKAFASCAHSPLNFCFSLSLPILEASTQQGPVEAQAQDES